LNDEILADIFIAIFGVLTITWYSYVPPRPVWHSQLATMFAASNALLTPIGIVWAIVFAISEPGLIKAYHYIVMIYMGVYLLITPDCSG
jgi:hypothetical protein